MASPRDLGSDRPQDPGLSQVFFFEFEINASVNRSWDKTAWSVAGKSLEGKMNAGVVYKLARIWMVLAALSSCVTFIEIIQKNDGEPRMDIRLITASAVVTLPPPVPLTSTPSPIPLILTTEPSDTPTPFNGAWSSIDIDGSRQEMYIGSGGEGIYSINFIDHSASFCEGSPIIGQGAGQIGSDDVMHTELDVHCLGGLEKDVDDVDYWLEFNETSDTLTDIWGITWNRTLHNP